MCVAFIKLFILRILTLRMAIAMKGRMNAEAGAGTVKVLMVSTGLTARSRIKTGCLTIVRICDNRVPYFIHPLLRIGANELVLHVVLGTETLVVESEVVSNVAGGVEVVHLVRLVITLQLEQWPFISCVDIPGIVAMLHGPGTPPAVTNHLSITMPQVT